MTEELKNMTKKAAKIAGVTCIAAGTVAVVASGAAVKAMVEGGKYLKDTVKKIMDSEPDQKAENAQVQTEEAAAEPVIEAEAVQEEAPAAEETV